MILIVKPMGLKVEYLGKKRWYKGVKRKSKFLYRNKLLSKKKSIFFTRGEEDMI